jgi:hypothetical protein
MTPEDVLIWQRQMVLTDWAALQVLTYSNADAATYFADVEACRDFEVSVAVGVANRIDFFTSVEARGFPLQQEDRL